MKDPYYKSRYKWDKNRTVVWKEIVKYLSPFIFFDSTVLDLGAGYCDFINNVKARNKIALDQSPDFIDFASPEVNTIQSSVTSMKAIKNDSIDIVFASNLLEHLDDDELFQTMSEVKRVLRSGGRIILMQPNYRLSYKNYFDDPTHKKIFTDVSLASFLESHNFEIELVKPRFLPFSMNSRPSLIPIFPLLIRAYLYSPFKPFAGQMLFVANKNNDSQNYASRL